MASTDLNTFLAAAGRRKFVWGQFDCLLFLADWFKVRTGVDPAAELRGLYDDEMTAYRLMANSGGIIKLIDGIVANFGWVTTTNPIQGDIGLVKVPCRSKEIVYTSVGAICVRPNTWAIKPADRVDLLVKQMPFVCAWTPNG